MSRMKNKLYDFDDFIKAVKNAAKRTTVVSMEPNMFYEWEYYTSTYKLSLLRPRPYLQQMVEVVFQRGSTNMKYRNTFSNEEFEEVNFFTAKILKSGQLPDPTPVLQPNGIDSTRKP
ncbi:hypothetical protein GE061_007321 [Apolygus lucorum]|uniref:Uncharacterized protein n=1 Tax=Apolygus lucorum TaxID=248454 RepID=A0A6A4JA37_APOLU|nr:hypothetical protein GE061_007321 [Apolygus lucorum]